MSTHPQAKVPNLPRCVFKADLAAYFGVSSRYLWQTILSEDHFDLWNIEREPYSSLKLLPPDLTRAIYVHYGITDLDQSLADELRASDGHRAPSDS